MHPISGITSDGPYLHVLLRDVLPPDWEALRHDLEPEIEEGRHARPWANRGGSRTHERRGRCGACTLGPLRARPTHGPGQ
jgi:hypothetical protein